MRSELGLPGDSKEMGMVVRTLTRRLQTYFPNLPLNSRLELGIVLRQQLVWAWTLAW